MDIQHPVIPACQDWSTLETLGRGREMIGLYLSAHPLDDYAVIIRNMCKTQLSDLDNLESLRGQEIAVAGMVIATQNLVTKTGKPWGKFTLEDYNARTNCAFQQGLRKFPQIPVQRLFPLHPGQGPTQALQRQGAGIQDYFDGTALRNARHDD